MSIAILATGDELTHGDSLNTTSQVVASALSHAGYPMGMHLVCGDKPSELSAGIQFLGSLHETLILTGGLGPTSDDRTRFALADYLKQTLVSYSEALDGIVSRLKKVNLSCNEGQKNQALFPKNAVLFENPHGTAWGCACVQGGKRFLMLPGPPKECLPMFETHALPYLKANLTPSDKVCLKWRLYGVPEGPMAEKLEKALDGIDCQLGYRLHRSETPYYLEFKVRCKPEVISAVNAVVNPLVKAYSKHQGSN